ncbi:MAG: hypothetical protein Q9186_003746 [Xanthomendoza sp. 1 TL-2023]
MVKHLLLPTLLALLTLTTAYVCFPPPGSLPIFGDCHELIESVKAMSRRPSGRGIREWSRHLPTTRSSENLPRWYYVERREAAESPSTCILVVDVAAKDMAAVERFALRNVVEAAEQVLFHCLIEKKQIGLEFPGDEGPTFVQVEKLDKAPILRMGMDGKGEGLRRVRLPGGEVLVVADGALMMEGAERINRTQS